MPPKKANGKKAKAHVDPDEELLKSYVAEHKNVAIVKKAAPTSEERKKKHREEQEAKAKSAANAFEEELRRKNAMEQLQQILMKSRNFGQMSSFLNKPITDVALEPVAEKHGTEACTGSVQGWRAHMEDAHICNNSFAPSPAAKDAEGWGLFSVFDGHAGAGTSKRCKIVLPALVQADMDEVTLTGKIEEASGLNIDKETIQLPMEAQGVRHLRAPVLAQCFLHKSYVHLDASLRDKTSDQSGSTAVTVVMTPKYYICANVGDSRALLCRRNGDQLEVVSLSVDHKPEDEEERKRIERLGGHVANNRVNGALAMSRAIGDYSYKQDKDKPESEQLVIPVPEVRIAKRTPKKAASSSETVEDLFLLVACDGVFDVFSNVAVAQLVHGLLIRQGLPIKEVTNEVCKRCVAAVHPDGDKPVTPEGTDNVTCTIVRL